MSPFEILKITVLNPIHKGNPRASAAERARLFAKHFEANRESRDVLYQYFAERAEDAIERIVAEPELPRARVTAPAPEPVRTAIKQRVETPAVKQSIVEAVAKQMPDAPAKIRTEVVERTVQTMQQSGFRARIAAEAMKDAPPKPVVRNNIVREHVVSIQEVRAPVARAVEKSVAVAVTQAAEHVNRVHDAKTEVVARVLLDWVMPNGKPIRQNTGLYMTQFGGFAGEVGRLVGPTALVGGLKGLTEQNLQNLMKRFVSETSKAA